MIITAPNTMRTFTFNGVKSSDYFLTRSISRSILPPINIVSIDVPQKAGAYSVRSELGVRTFEVEITLLQDSYVEMRKDIREIAQWLYVDQDSQLIFSDEPDKYYLARLSGDTNLDEIAIMGEGVLTFVALDPIAYSTVEKNQSLTNVSTNLLPYNDFRDLTKWQDWYLNGTYSNITFPSGAFGLRYTMTNFGVNPRLRASTSTDNVAQVTAGQTYTVSIRIRASWEITKLELIAVQYQLATPLMEDWPSVELATLPIENTQDGTRLYTKTFTASNTAGIKVMFGAGLGNPNMKNGAYIEVRDIRVESGSTATNEDITVTNLGTFEAFPRIRLVPTVTMSKIILTNGSKRLILNGNFPGWVVIIIDCNTNLVYDEATGKRMMTSLDIDSEFWSLEPGDNFINFTPSTVDLRVTVYWRERFL